MGSYRQDIDIGDKYLFGTELEFTGVYLDNLSKLFRDNKAPVKLALNHKSTGFTKYDEWYLDLDSTVSKRKDGRLFGGELSSRILVDKKKTWLELRDICDILKSAGASINGTCSNHVRVNLSCITNERYFFEVLAKLITIFEIDMRLFYMGDDYLVRQSSFEYARTLSDYLLNYINSVDFSDPDFFYKFKNYRGMNFFTSRDAINLQDYESKKLMEVRYPNGSIKEKTIQNNINFTLKLVDAIRREVFDPQELTRRIEVDSDDIYIRSFSKDPDVKDFEFLVNSISTSSEDVDDFMSQYEHVLSKRPKF